MPVDGEFEVGVDSDTSFRYAGTPNDIVARHLSWGDLKHWERYTWPQLVVLASRSRGSSVEQGHKARGSDGANPAHRS
jgi:hypothetical protein